MEDVNSNTFIRSKFLHLFNNKNETNVYCLYHSLTKKKVYGTEILKDIFNLFNTASGLQDIKDQLNVLYENEIVEKIINDLLQKELLVRNSEEDVTKYFNFLYHGTQQYNICHTYFIPASDCNLRCTYCFVEDEKREIVNNLMTIEIARKSLEIFAKLTEDAEKISLTFYGGEPLLNPATLYFSMKYVRELEEAGAFKKAVDMTLLTNGTLVNEKTVNALKNTKSSVSVSIDGPEWIHNSARVHLNKTGSFKEAIRGFMILQNAGLKPGVSCTLSSYNIEHIDEVVDFITNELKPPAMGFNILLPILGSGNPLDVDHYFATEQLIKAFKKLRSLGIYEDRIMRRVLPFKDDFFHFKDCMGVGGQIVITPDGRIGPCQAFQNIKEYFPLSVENLYEKINELNSEVIYKDPMFNEWRKRFPLNMPECVNCSAIAVCGGGCPYAALINHDSIWAIDERICFQAKQILDWMIWETYEYFAVENVE